MYGSPGLAFFSKLVTLWKCRSSTSNGLSALILSPLYRTCDHMDFNFSIVSRASYTWFRHAMRFIVFYADTYRVERVKNDKQVFVKNLSTCYFTSIIVCIVLYCFIMRCFECLFLFVRVYVLLVFVFFMVNVHNYNKMYYRYELVRYELWYNYVYQEWNVVLKIFLRL
jgi:hypothetical protein